MRSKVGEKIVSATSPVVSDGRYSISSRASRRSSPARKRRRTAVSHSLVGGGAVGLALERHGVVSLRAAGAGGPCRGGAAAADRPACEQRR